MRDCPADRAAPEVHTIRNKHLLRRFGRLVVCEKSHASCLSKRSAVVAGGCPAASTDGRGGNDGGRHRRGAAPDEDRRQIESDVVGTRIGTARPGSCGAESRQAETVPQAGFRLGIQAITGMNQLPHSSADILLLFPPIAHALPPASETSEASVCETAVAAPLAARRRLAWAIRLPWPSHWRRHRQAR